MYNIHILHRIYFKLITYVCSQFIFCVFVVRFLLQNSCSDRTRPFFRMILLWDISWPMKRFLAGKKQYLNFWIFISNWPHISRMVFVTYSFLKLKLSNCVKDNVFNSEQFFIVSKERKFSNTKTWILNALLIRKREREKFFKFGLSPFN